MKFVKKHYVSMLIVVWALMVIGTPFLFVTLTPESGGMTRELAFRLGIIASAFSVGLQAVISLREKHVQDSPRKSPFA